MNARSQLSRVSRPLLLSAALALSSGALLSCTDHNYERDEPEYNLPGDIVGGDADALDLGPTDFDTTLAVCGNGIAESGELCDGQDLAGSSCETLGFLPGQLSCGADCASWDTSLCDGSTCPPDAFEPNDLVGGAPRLMLPTALDGAICDGDIDNFAFDLGAGQRLVATLDFVHALGDLELALYVPDIGLVASSTGVGNREELVWAVDSPTTVVVQVFGASDDVSNTYQLRVATDVDNCEPGQFACGMGVCVPGAWACDGIADCGDGSDEAPLNPDCDLCGEGRFQCRDGSCVPAEWTCDGFDDCPDASDEAPVNPLCQAGCGDNQFTCFDGSCIPDGFFCDTTVDCPDASDEAPVNANCDINCGPGLFNCFDGSCVDVALTCDGTNNCAGGEDEAPLNPSCQVGDPELCANGVDDDGDGLIDCEDFDDCEASPACICGPGLFACGTSNGGDAIDCIPSPMVCDGAVDCFDGSDEAPLNPECPIGSECPQVSLGVGALTFSGSTSGFDNDTSSGCGGGNGLDVTHEWLADASGCWRFSTSGTNFDTVLSVRGSCNQANELSCDDDSGTGAASELEVDLSAGQSVVVVVDGFNSTANGPYTLQIARCDVMVAELNCIDMLDNDNDGRVDCDDPDCAGAPVCQPGFEICDNGLDDDNDGAIDCGDADCANSPLCGAPEQCANGLDDDNDGQVDCLDGDCFGHPACSGAEICDNGQDDDNDGRADCDDPDCVGSPGCVPSQWTCPPQWYAEGDCDCGCGVQDPDCSVPTANVCLFCNETGSCDQSGQGCPGNIDPNRNWTCVGATAEVCDNGLDDDGDGRTDCADVDCTNHPACGMCLPDGEMAFDPAQCCNGDPDGNFLCGDQGNMCIGPGQECTLGAGDSQCCLPGCKDGAPLGAPSFGFCCIGDGFDYQSQPPPANTDYICCNADTDGDGRCGSTIGIEVSCTNGIDDDGDGAADCADPDCAMDPACQPGFEICNNGLDDDADGAVDCLDSDCVMDPACQATGEICDNGLDDDGDGFFDCADPECVNDPICMVAPEDCTNGFDDDFDGAVDCADPDCAIDPVCLPGGEVCDNGQDDDGDGAIDCDDTVDCAGHPACIAVCPDIELGTSTGSPVFVGSSAGRSNDYNGSCPGGNGPDVAHRWTAPSNGCFRVTTNGSQFDTVLTVYDSCAAATELACDDDGGNGTNSRLTLNAVQAGEDYLIVVDGFGSASQGDYVLNVFPCAGTELNCNDGVDNDGDGAVDCADSDCANRPVCGGCPPGAIACVDGTCVAPAQQCDGINHCPDGADEAPLNPVCAPTPEVCTNGIDDDGDNAVDCADPDCVMDPACAPTPEICNNGQDDDGDGDTDCLDPDCAGDPACGGCGPGQFACGDGQCIPDSWVCDDWADCNDLTDEAPFNPSCGPCAANDFVCDNGVCIDQGRQCNGIDQCGDGSDEAPLNPACMGDPEVCNDGLDNDNDGAVDCADTDCVMDPACAPTPEICNNGQDDDGDGFFDCADPDCIMDPACLPGVEICDNGLDDDGDGAVDCADPDCIMDPACLPGVEICDNGLDDDGDGALDCFDPDCLMDPACVVPPENCSNGIDDDGDGAVDCADSECAGNPGCVPTEICDNGIDDDGDLRIDCTDFDCATEPSCVESVCDDGLDNDSDGLIDCVDPDCENGPLCAEVCDNGTDDDGDGAVDCFDTDCDCQAPPEWTCPTTWFDDNFCDCGCGVQDPDCPVTTSDICEFCNNPGSCDQTGQDCPGIIDPNQNWTCVGGGTTEICNNGLDDDADGDVDCIDADCVMDPACSGGLSCPTDDGFEENDEPFSASFLMAPTDEQAILCSDEDWYAFQASAGQTLDFQVAFFNSNGNIDIELYDATTQMVVASSSSTSSDVENVTVTAGSATVYGLRVFSPAPVSNAYSLSVIVN